MNVVVVGGGISGLVTAYRLMRSGVDVTLLEASERAGGKIHTSPFAGLPAVDAGADAFLVRVPHAVALCRELGFSDELLAPSAGNAYLWSRGTLRSIPTPNFLGVPLDPDALDASGLVTAHAVEAVRADLLRTHDTGQPDGDESVGSLVRRRLGDEVLERLVDPLLGGIYAGDADRLSLEAGAPQFAAAARSDASLVRALRAQRDAAATSGGPVFLAPPDGMGRVVHELARQLGERVRYGRPVGSIERNADGWRVDTLPADAVVLATPAFVTAELLADIAPHTAALARDIEYSGVVLVTFAFAREAIDRPLDASGFLVPKVEGMLLTACSWSSAKWAHLDRGDHVLLRASAGHYGNERALGLDDKLLVAEMVDELAQTMDVRDQPTDVRISRWPRAFPQYTPGHAARVAALDATLATEAPGIAVTGAAYRGIGIPACIGAANDVAGRVIT